MLVEYRIRIRNAANSADALVVSSVRGDTNPYLSSVPSGDGASFNPITGVVTSGSYTARVTDPITSGTSRLFSSQLEDVNGRQQLGHRREFIELREDGGAWQTLHAGRLERYGLTSDIEWENSVDDWMKYESDFTLFDKSSETETINSFLARWPNRGTLFGGPVIGGLTGIQPDYGGWEMKVVDSSGGASTRYRLEPVRIYGPGEWRPGYAEIIPLSIPINEAVQDLGRPSLKFTTTAPSTIKDLYDAGTGWLGLVVLIQTTPGGSWVAWRPMDVFGGNGKQDEIALKSLVYGGERGGSGPGIFVWKDDQTALTIGSVVRVRCLTILPSEISPIFWTGHPADFLANAWTEAGLPYSASAITTVKQTLGNIQVTLVIEGPEPMGSYLEQAIYGPFGIGARVNSAGELEAFCSRIFPNTLPSIVIDKTMVYQGETKAFDLDTSEAIRKIAVEAQLLERDPTAQSLHGVAIGSIRIERGNADPDAIGKATQEYKIPGMVRFTDGRTDIRLWTDARAREIFDRTGRGPIRLRTVVKRGSAAMAAKLGDEVLINLPQLPKGNKRLLDDATISPRAMQIVHLTPTPRGNEIECEDSGPNASPLSTLPTHTIAKSTDSPRRIAEVTITNAAALNAVGYGLRLQLAITSGGAPALTDYADLGFYDEGAVPTTAIRLPPATTGKTVYARARAEDTGVRPSAWSTGVSVALDAISAPTSVVAASVSGDGSQEDITWVIGASATDCETDIWIRASGAAFGTAIRVRTMPPGSTKYRVEGLTPNTAYTVSVQHRDPVSGDTSAVTDVTFTSANATLTLTAPINQVGFSSAVSSRTLRDFGRRGNQTRGDQYGIAVMAVEFPGYVEIYEAVETSEGSGSYGTSATVGVIPSRSDDWTIWVGSAPNDRLRRRLKARHVRDGAAASSFTSEVTVSPWTTSPLAMHAAPQGTVSIDAAGAAKFSVDGGFNIGSYKWDKSTSSYPADATVASSGTTADGRTQNDVSTGTTLTLGQRIYITVVPFSGPSATGVQGPSIHLTATRHDASATKTVRYSAMSLMPMDDFSSSHFTATAGYVRPINTVNGDDLFFRMIVPIPDGVTITNVTHYSKVPATGASPKYSFVRMDTTGGTALPIVNSTAGGTGWIATSDNISESTTSRRYALELWFDVTVAAEEADYRSSSWDITYTMPSTVNSI